MTDNDRVRLNSTVLQRRQLWEVCQRLFDQYRTFVVMQNRTLSQTRFVNWFAGHFWEGVVPPFFDQIPQATRLLIVGRWGHYAFDEVDALREEVIDVSEQLTIQRTQVHELTTQHQYVTKERMVSALSANDTKFLRHFTPFRTYQAFDRQFLTVHNYIRNFCLYSNEKGITFRRNPLPTIKTRHAYFMHLARIKRGDTVRCIEVTTGRKYDQVCRISNKVTVIIGHLFEKHSNNRSLLNIDEITRETPRGTREEVGNVGKDCYVIDGKLIKAEKSQDPELQAFSWTKRKKINGINFLAIMTMNGNYVVRYMCDFGRVPDKTTLKFSGWLRELIIHAKRTGRKIRLYVDKGFDGTTLRNNPYLEVIRTGRKETDDRDMNAADQSFLDARNRIVVEQAFSGLFKVFKGVNYFRWISAEYFLSYLHCAVYYLNHFIAPFSRRGN